MPKLYCCMTGYHDGYWQSSFEVRKIEMCVFML